jgi:branched-subunit amino acid transport protein
LIFLNGLWSPSLLWWRILRMCVIEYFFRLLFLILLCSEAL